MPVDLPSPPLLAHSVSAPAIHSLRHQMGLDRGLRRVPLDLSGMIALGSVVIATLVSVFIVGALAMMLAGIAGALGIGFSRSRDWGHFHILWVLGGLLYIVAESSPPSTPCWRAWCLRCSSARA